MVAWYTKAPAGDWKPPMAGTTSNNGMGLVALLAIVLLANMTSLLFCLFFALIGADAVSLVKHGDTSGAVLLLLNSVAFGLGPSALAKVHKRIVKVLLAPVRNKYKVRMKQSSNIVVGNVERGVEHVIQMLSFETPDLETKLDGETRADTQDASDSHDYIN